MNEVNPNYELFKNLKLTDGENKFINSVNGIDNQTPLHVPIQKKVSLSVIYLAKQIEKSSISNDKNAKKMFYLTLAIGIVGLSQIAEIILKLLGFIS